jgi:CubicO group peptidase (beta-lactamase class C family)
MKWFLLRSLALASVVGVALLCQSCPASREPHLRALGGDPVAVGKMETLIAKAMKKADVAGLCVAIINDSRVVYTNAFGDRDRKSGLAFNEETVTGAASLSKTVFAYLVVLLMEDGIIDPDKPLHEYLPRPLPQYPNYTDLAEDDRWKEVTARTVLSHSTGLPNWRFIHPTKRLVFMFDPGDRFSYSGEGIALLQMVVEEITGQGLEELAQERVFRPFGMTRTSYVWHDEFQDNHALPHDEFGRTRRYKERSVAEAAGSMVTTAADYGRFLVGMLNARGVRERAFWRMLEPQIRITSQRMFGPGAWQNSDANDAIGLSWCLGWGRFETPRGRAFFHTGHDFGYQNYTVTHVDAGVGVVLLSNSDNFESVAEEIVVAVIGDDHTPFEWLGYEPFDPSMTREPPPEPVAIDVDPAKLEAYAGSYALSPDETIVVRMGEDGLQISTDQEEWSPLLPESETRFFVEEEDIRFVFMKDESGDVSTLNLEIQGLTIPAPRTQP